MQSLLANNTISLFLFDISDSIQNRNEYNIETFGKITFHFNENYNELNRD